MKVFKAEEAKARVAEFLAESERLAQRSAEVTADSAFDEIREKSAKGGRYITLSIMDVDVRKRVIDILKSAGYTVKDDFTRVWVNWGE